MNKSLWFLVSIMMAIPAKALDAIHTKSAIVIDGRANETDWAKAPWYKIDQHILGAVPTPDDFSGRFKMLWDDQQIYLLAEITDDQLFDRHPDPLDSYWDDDCLEIFVDEDKSGGNHQFNFNAFAYHVALDNQIVDIGESNEDGTTNFVLLNEHVTSQWRRQASSPHHIIWELSIRIYDKSFSLRSNAKNKPVNLSKNKQLGFMVAYCDNDGSYSRESFMGSTAIVPQNGNKNLGYITSDVFDTLILK
ncbi:MAG: sugar-binding protein [Gammaproteobacteria bacterium MedPE]|nr:MAG: sugar-binding protein [Gammaproteobacteria bacterium MedPE]